MGGCFMMADQGIAKSNIKKQEPRTSLEEHVHVKKQQAENAKKLADIRRDFLKTSDGGQKNWILEINSLLSLLFFG